MPTRCNRGFYCISYCLLNMFRAPLCTSSGAQECYTVVAACGISCCSILQTGHITLSSTPDQQLENHSTEYHRQQPLYNTLELLMMGIVVPETCWASNKICNKNLCCIKMSRFSEVSGPNLTLSSGCAAGWVEPKLMNASPTHQFRSYQTSSTPYRCGHS